MNDVRPKIVIAVIVSVFAIGVVGCGERKPLSTREIIEQVNASGKITGTLIIRALNRRVMHL